MKEIPFMLNVENSTMLMIAELSNDLQNAKIKLEKSNAIPNIQLGV